MNPRSSSPKSDPDGPSYVGLRLAVAVFAAVVLVLTGDGQIYDSNLYVMSAVTAILAGDHPYRDFYETGVPLAAYLSAGAQLLTGRRLIGEFLVQWLLTVGGVVISFHLALRLSRSVAASLATVAITVVLLATTPIYHHSKLFFFPLTIWLAWRYMDDPGVRRSAPLGVTAALAFLYRHDYGVYIGFASVLALALGRLSVPASRNIRAFIGDGVALGASVLLILAPWLVVVQRNEGLHAYVRLRADLYQQNAVSGSPYQSLLRMNPARAITPDALPPARPGRLGIEWAEHVDPTTRDRLERSYGLRPRQPSESTRLSYYDVSNVYDARLAEVEAYVHESEGVDWPLLLASRSWVPGRKNAELWLYQISLLVPLLALAGAVLNLSTCWWQADSVPPETYRIVIAAAFVVVIELSLLREQSYFLVVTPLTAVLGARLVAGSRHVIARAIALGALLVTSFATVGYVHGTGIFAPVERLRNLRPTFEQLFASPPIDGYHSAGGALAIEPSSWNDGSVDRGKLLTRYLHDCTRAGDRILVSGLTPFHISYYAGRPMAGGHIFWHRGWRSDAVHEKQLLALLQTQSVPFAFSTHDPVLEDLKRYPSIRNYFATHYVELEGSHGVLLIDTRRQPTGRFGRLGFPCFQ